MPSGAEASTSSTTGRTPIPNAPGFYNRKDYAAACKDLHIKLLHCYKQMSGISYEDCTPLYKEFWACVKDKQDQRMVQEPVGEAWKHLRAQWEDLKRQWPSVKEKLQWSSVKQQASKLYDQFMGPGSAGSSSSSGATSSSNASSSSSRTNSS
jgi:hypothetical protein